MPSSSNAATQVHPASRRTADCVEVLHDVLLKEEWFAERPPLALAVVHPLTRLHCEMWRAHCTGQLTHCTTTAASHHTHSVRKEEEEGSAGSTREGGARASSLYVHVGRTAVANPAALEVPPIRGAANFTRPSLTSPAMVFAASPYASLSRQEVCSLLPSLNSAATQGAQLSAGEPWTQRRWRSNTTPVVDPSTPLYSLDTYTEKILQLPIGMKVGHCRLVTTSLPIAAEGEADVESVRGLYCHVPAAVTLSAAHRAAGVLRDAASAAKAATALRGTQKVCGVGKEAAAGGRVSQNCQQQQQQHVPPVESDSEGTAAEDEEDKAKDVAGGPIDDDEDDWETAALLEEAQLEEAAMSRGRLTAAAVTDGVVRTSAVIGVPHARAEQASAQRVLPSSPRGVSAPYSSSPPTVKVVPALKAWALAESEHDASRTATSAALDSVTAVLPPPSAWWLQRRLTAASRASVPLYVHCVEPTRQWVEWVDALQHPGSEGVAVSAADATHNTVDLRGVSLSGWSNVYVPNTFLSPCEPAQRSSGSCGGSESCCRVEEAVPRTLPLRGLHLETSVGVVTALLDVRARAAVWRDSLVALDLPHLRGGVSAAATEASSEHLHPAPPPPRTQRQQDASLSDTLEPLRQLRYLSLNRSTDVHLRTSIVGGDEDAGEDVRLLEELRLFCVADLTAAALAATSRRCIFLRMVDLSSTAITEVELHALVFGSTCSDDASVVNTQPSPLVWLEELRLAACHALLRLRPLPALPSLRRLTLQSSGVCHLADLVGCNALEEIVLTRCEHVSELHPLWRLPRLRCVEADGVRRLLMEEGLLPPQLTSHTTAAAVEAEETLLAAPLCRLNLSHSALVHSTAVARLAASLHDISGRLHALTTLLLDHTAINDDAIEALAGMSSRGGGGGVAATALLELSLAGCFGVHHLGPLGLLPRLTRIVADGANVEHLDGLQRSPSLTFLSLAHCTRVWSIAALATLPTLRTLDVSRTFLNDAGLLRFVFPDLVSRLVTQQLHAASPFDVAAAEAHVTAVPSRLEELRIYQCTALRYIGCLAHLPCLRRLDVSDTAVFDCSFVGFYAAPMVLLRVQLRAATAVAASLNASTWAEEEQGRGTGRRASEMATAPIPNEVAMLREWRQTRRLSSTAAITTSADESHMKESAAAATAAAVKGREFVFEVGAAQTLTDVSLAYCAEVRGITPFALFHRLTALDLMGTVVDSAALLAFVNVLHECCDATTTGDSADPQMALETEKDGLRAYARQGGGQSRTGGSAVARRYTLTSLTLSFCHYLTDVRCCATVPSLRHLTLCGTPIDNTTIESLAAPPVLPCTALLAERRWWRRHHCALQSLDLRYCRGVTDVSTLLSTQVEELSTLDELHLGHSGVMASKAELCALHPRSRCRITI